MAIGSHRSADSVSPAWIQVHGHAQIFGWIGTFILGIGESQMRPAVTFVTSGFCFCA